MASERSLYADDRKKSFLSDELKRNGETISPHQKRWKRVQNVDLSLICHMRDMQTNSLSSAQLIYGAQVKMRD